MSEHSVSSSGSRVRQFGLYRTIDARTEEFLRLSRKRQLRQGCACAAVSTAITVSVVVIILLLYKYNVRMDAIRKLGQKGFAIVNKTDENHGTIFHKTEFNFNKTTLKLVPILVKAINNNDLLQKISKDYTTTNPKYEKRDTTEFTYEKNIFSGDNYWIRFPTSRLFAVEYKTVPVAYYKTPRNVDYFTKVRKIRDYERIMKYISKMINERVTYGSTLPMKREYSNYEQQTLTEQSQYEQQTTTEAISDSETINSNLDMVQYIDTTAKTKTKDNEQIVNCDCPKKITEILNKLLLNIKLLIPQNISNELGSHSPRYQEKVKNLRKVNTEIFTPTLNQEISEQNIPLQTMTKYEAQDHELLLSPKVQDHEQQQKNVNMFDLFKNSKISNNFTSLKHQLKTTNSLINQYNKTKALVFKESSTYSTQNFSNYFKSIIKNINHSTTELFYENKSEKLESHTTPNIVEAIMNLDVNELELVKRKIFSMKKSKKIVLKNPSADIIEYNFSDKIDRKWFYDVTTTDSLEEYFKSTTEKQHYDHHLLSSQISTHTSTTSETETLPISKTLTTPSFLIKMDIFTTNQIQNTTAYFTKAKIEAEKQNIDTKLVIENKNGKINEENIFSDEIPYDEFEKIVFDDNYEDDDIKDMRVINSLTSLHPNNLVKETESISETILKSLEFKKSDEESEDNIISASYQNQPRSYLEIKSNNFKHDDNKDK